MQHDTGGDAGSHSQCLMDYSTVWSAQYAAYGGNPNGNPHKKMECVLALLDAVVAFDSISVPYVPATGRGMYDFASPLLRAGILQPTAISEDELTFLRTYVSELTCMEERIEPFVQSVLALVEHPWYWHAHELFGHHGVFGYFGGVEESGLLLDHAWASELFDRACRGAPLGERGDRFCWRLSEGRKGLYQTASFLLRGVCYGEIARNRAIGYFPHPLRGGLSPVLSQTGKERPSETLTLAVLDFSRDLRSEILKAMEKQFVGGFLALDLPPIAATVLRRSETPDDIIPRAIELRDSAGAKALRRWIAQVQRSLLDGKTADFLCLVDQLCELKRQLLSDFGFSPETLSANLGLFAGSPKIPCWLREKAYEMSGGCHIHFLYDVVRQSVAISDLLPDFLRLFWFGTDVERVKQRGFPETSDERNWHIKEFTYLPISSD